MRKSKAFTLIELLVVISIIGLLMAILLPALGKARAAGQRIVCANHMKTLMTASFIYSEKYDGAFVPVVYRVLTPGGGRNQEVNDTAWLANRDFRSYIGVASRTPMDSLGPFDVPKEYLCPSDKISKDPSNNLSGVLCSYGYNYTEWCPHSGWMPPLLELEEGRKWYAGNWTQQIKQPSEKLAFIDGIDWWAAWAGADYKNAWDLLGQASIETYRATPATGIHGYGPTLYRHNEGANLAFYDGHVNWLRKQEVYIQSDYPCHPGMWVANLSFYFQYHPQDCP